MRKCDITDRLRCMSSCPEQARFAIGSVDRTIYVYDSRSSSNKPISQYRPNNATVFINLAMNAEYILSASLDGTVSIWDQRTERIMRSITIPDEATPTCMSMRRDNWVCVGDDKAKLHMLNLNNDIELHTALITGGASDARMPDNEFSIRPRQNFDPYGSAKAHRYFTFSVPRYPQLLSCSNMDYLNDTLAIGGLGERALFYRRGARPPTASACRRRQEYICTSCNVARLAQQIFKETDITSERRIRELAILEYEKNFAKYHDQHSVEQRTHARTHISPRSKFALFATGSFHGTIYVFDSRSSSNKPYRQYQPHTTKVNKLAMNTEYILSASWDETVSVWDQRAGRIMKSIRIPDKATPECVSMRRDNWVCVADSKAKLHMLDPKNDFKLVKSYSTEATCSYPLPALTGVHLTHGCLITSWNSSDGTIVRILSPTNPPKPITTKLLKREFICSGTTDYLNDILVVAGQKLVIWRPRNRQRMDDENPSCAHDGKECAQLSLLRLSVEIFLHICSFVDASTLMVHSLNLMCKQFYQILKDADESLWKARINHIWPNATHSLLSPARPDKLFWKLSCIAIEKQTALWKQQDSMEKLIYVGTKGEESMARVFVTDTCRMESLVLRNTGYIHLANDEYIIDLTAIDNTIYSCSVYYIKTWMLTNTGFLLTHGQGQRGFSLPVYTVYTTLTFVEPPVSSSRSSKNIQICTVRERMNDENARCAHDDEEYAQLSLLRLLRVVGRRVGVLPGPIRRKKNDGEEYAQLSLLQLPVEMFLHICSFLDASTLVHGLSLVCKQFYQILKDADESLWKARILPNASHSLLCPERPHKLFWKLSCVAFEKQTALWKQQNSMENLRFRRPYYATSVLLMPVNGITYLVGKKDHSLFYKKLSYGNKDPFHEVDVWTGRGLGSLTAINHTVYNCCPDNTVKSWVLTNIGLVHDRTYILKCGFKLRCDLRDVSSCPEQALFATGSFDGTIYVFDSRSSSNKPYRQYRPHTTDVTKLVMNTEYILSASKDKTVSVWDQRAGRTMKSITIPDEATPTCMSMRRDNWVCVGDTKAKLHMLNPKNNLELVKSYSTEHTRTITGVYLTRGCLITSSHDGTVRISSPTDPPRSIATLVHCTEPRTISQCAEWGACMSLCLERVLFATGSSCGTIYVFDSRLSNKPIREYRPRPEVIPDEATPTCMSMRRDNWVCVGDTKAKLHMLNPKNNFELVKSYSTEHTDSIRGVRLTHGCRITSSKGGIVRISSPTDPPKLIATLRTGYGNINSMDYLNDTLAIVSGQSLGVWRPKSTCLTKHH
ncbi:hypothetical protein DBV15_05442 [Temnothorax longispinosus]|uniref:F-box domain-containing protein n=1 Tax=Temnothorax longispinosus TaxID=300112 RepID=A0A4S2KU42_9HYME|nr:hypothetical protein DBV15_05442 [Temnothorax longispinosus]